MPLQQILLSPIDYAILVVYFLFVLCVGWALRRHVKSSEDFFLSGRSIPARVARLAFLSANLGAQEVIGIAASGAKHGIMTSHFYWVGAIPATVIVGIFMMPFYYGSRARSVPEYLKLRFDEKTRGFNAISFAVMTVFSSGISMYALAKLLALVVGWNFHASVVLSATIVLAYIFLGGLTRPSTTRCSSSSLSCWDSCRWCCWGSRTWAAGAASPTGWPRSRPTPGSPPAPGRTRGSTWDRRRIARCIRYRNRTAGTADHPLAHLLTIGDTKLEHH